MGCVFERWVGGDVSGEKRIVMEMDLVPELVFAKIHFILVLWRDFKPRLTKLSLFF